MITTEASEAAETGGIGDSEWSLYWTDRHGRVPAGFLPLLDQWADIDQREAALGVEGRTPILIDPQARIDGRIAKFLRRSRFAFRAEGTQIAYVKDYRLFSLSRGSGQVLGRGRAGGHRRLRGVAATLGGQPAPDEGDVLSAYR